MSSGSVRVRLTLVVAMIAGLLGTLAATIGASRVERSLIDEAIDAEVDRVLPGRGLLVSVPIEDVTLDDPELAELLEQEGVTDPAGEEAAELRELFDDVPDFYADELAGTANDLDELGILDPLLRATGRSRDDGLPVLTEFGVVAVVGIDGRPTTFPDVDVDVVDFDGPLTLEFNLQELLFGAFVFDPSEVIADAVARGVVLDEAAVAELLDDETLYAVDAPSLATGKRVVDEVELVVGVDGSDVERSVDRVRTVVWVATPALMVLAGLLTWSLTSRALSPVRRMTRRVDEISSGTLHERVPVPDTGDEIEELATTMNGMLDRLEVDDKRLRQFVSDASHELRSPVAVLRSEAEVALRSPERTDPRAFADGVLGESLRLERIVDDLLLLARRQEAASAGAGSAPPSPFDLDDVVFAEAGRRRRVPIETSGVSAGRVAGSKHDATRLVAHLLDNGARHAVTRVAVSLAADDGETVVLTVDDDGPGVAADDRERVFERFTRLEEARTRDNGGAGLGLAVVAATVQGMGGTVGVEDAPELGGARFAVRLPAVG